MLHRHIKSLPHHPKRVVVVSLIIAVAIGTFGYIKINQKPDNLYNQLSSENITNNKENISPSQSLTLGFLSSGRIKTVSVKPGDMVRQGDVLATLDAGNVLGALIQAKASYSIAKANYEKIINGATGTNIDVAKAAVNTAEVNFEQITNQQKTLVTNARRKLFSDNLIAEPDSNNYSAADPIISGNYDGLVEGDYFISFKNINFVDVEYGGLERGITEFDTLPQPLGTKGLLISFPNGSSGRSFNNSWTIHIPNKSGINYTNNYNTYQLALDNQSQAVKNAQAVLDQANASFSAFVAGARPEDIAVGKAQMDNALGAVEIAQAAYNNTIITAPSDGIVMSVSITPGQIAIPNIPAIEFFSKALSN